MPLRENVQNRDVRASPRKPGSSRYPQRASHYFSSVSSKACTWSRNRLQVGQSVPVFPRPHPAEMIFVSVLPGIARVKTSLVHGRALLAWRTGNLASRVANIVRPAILGAYFPRLRSLPLFLLPSV
jgi:hypothetical protein